MSRTPRRADTCGLRAVATLLVVALCLASCARPDTSVDDLERTADAAADWLVRHQLDDGSWSGAAFDLACPDEADLCDGLAGSAVHDVGVTALAALALLASPETAQRHADAVDRALDHLVARQDSDGHLSDPLIGDFTYDHALATLALARAIELDARDDLRPTVQAAVDAIARLRTPGSGWRYAEFHAAMRRHRADTSVTTWMLAALRAAERVGVAVDDASLAAGLAFVVEMTDDDEERARQSARDELAAGIAELERLETLHDDSATSARAIDAQRSFVETLRDDVPRARATSRTGYVARGGFVERLDAASDAFPWSRSEACTAAALVCRLGHVGHVGDVASLDAAHRAMLDRCLAELPDVASPEAFDAYGWHFVSTAVSDPRVPARDARTWRRALAATLAATQRDDGCARGSFDPHRFAWGSMGGRVYQTAIAALAANAHRGRVLPAP